MSGTIKFIYQPDNTQPSGSVIDAEIMFSMEAGYTYYQVGQQFFLFLRAMGYQIEKDPYEDPVDVDYLVERLNTLEKSLSSVLFDAAGTTNPDGTVSITMTQEEFESLQDVVS